MPPDGINTKLILTNTLLDTIATETAAIDSNTAGLSSAISGLQSAIEAMAEDIVTLSAFLQLAIGTFSEAEPGTILATLRQMAICVCAAISGLDPSGTAPNGCDEPLASLSDRLLTDDDFPGRAFIEWDSVLPQGVELSSDVYPDLPTGIELHLTGDNAYYIWVQSACETFRTTPESASEYPTNSWVAIDGPNTIAVNLAVGCAGSAFLCIDPNLGFVDCVTRVSSIVETVHASVDNSDRDRLSVPLDGLGLPLITEMTVGGHTFTTNSDVTWVESDAHSYVYTWISGVRIRVWWLDTGGSFGSQILNSGGTTHTMSAHTDVWGVDNWQDPEGDLDEPFTVQICPPTPE